MKYIKKDDLPELYNNHMKIDSFDTKDIKEALQICGELIDVSYYLKRKEGIEKAISHLLSLEKKKLESDENGKLYYYFGNAYSELSKFDQAQKNPWENKNIEKAIFYYRKALCNKLDLTIKNQIIINLANSYFLLGRFIKSIELYQTALKKSISEYTSYMARGNMGIALMHYEDINHDSRQKIYFSYFAYHLLKKALESSKDNLAVKNFFKKHYQKVNKDTCSDIKFEDLKLNDFSIGKSEKEKHYRQWCLNNRLFLNPMNDLGEYNIAAHDVLHLPNMIFDISQNHLEFPSFFNQLKQEYVSARYLLYEGINNIGKRHFSDREVRLINPLDYPRYSLNIEKIKISFKALYSMFDKISLFLKEYLKLPFKTKEVNFKIIWYRKKEVNNHIIQNNRAFQGLFLISKDLLFHHPDIGSSKELSLSLEPSAKKINTLRNYLEHRYVKVHEYNCDSLNNSILKDNLSYSIKESDLIDWSLKLCKLCREALIYLSLGIYIEEKSKKTTSEDKIISDIYEDEWKY